MSKSVHVLLWIALTVLLEAAPAAAARNAPPAPFSQEQLQAAIQAEAQLLVEGFVTEFPETLKAMPDNPFIDRMDRLERLLADHRFQAEMVHVARQLLSVADLDTILKARYQGVWSQQYLKEMVRLSLLFAEKVTPMIQEKLKSPVSVTS